MPTKEQIIEAAGTSPEAKKALKKLFPEYFEDEKYFDLLKLVISNRNEPTKKLFTTGSVAEATDNVAHTLICVRHGSSLEGRGFWLTDVVDWSIKRDEYGASVLVPTRKEK